MVNIFKIKRYWVLTICMVFCSLTSVIGQELNDKQIGFDAARISASLKSKGITDEFIEQEIKKMRVIYKNQYLTMKNSKETILQELTPVKSARRMAMRTTANSTVAIPETERAALIDFYNSTNGADWYDHSGWDVNDPASDIQTWYGVVVNEGHVVGLSLNYNGLTGSISNLSGLPELQILDVSANNFNNTIIEESITNLTNLKTLNLNSCSFTGTIPNLSSLSNLQDLNLSGNNFSGSQIPDWINNLTSLNNLYLNDSYLSGTIPNLGSLSNLSNFNIGNNNFSPSAIPSWISNFVSLQTLNLYNSNFIGSVPDLSVLNQLTILNLSGNNFNTNIPETLNNLTNLNSLDLSFSHFNGTIPNLAALIKLNSLSLLYNEFSSAPMPLWFNSLTALNTLNVANCNFSGPVTDLPALVNLTALNLSNNNFNLGSIPTWIFNSNHLMELALNNCNLNGSIPSEIGYLTDLQFLYLHNNKLEGVIPPEITTLGNLQVFWISNNRYRFIDLDAQFERLSSLSSFSYQPQAKTDTEKNTSAATGNSITLTMFEDNRYIQGNEGDKFQWFKNEMSIPGAISKDYTISYLTAESAGIYYCISTNTKMDELTLERSNILLNVANCDSETGEIKVEGEQLCMSQISNFSFETSATNLSYIWSVTDTNGVTVDTSVLNSTGLYSFNFPGAGNYTLRVITTNKTTKCSTMRSQNLNVISCEVPSEEICLQNSMNVVLETEEANLNYKWSLKETGGTIVNEVSNTSGTYSFAFANAGIYQLTITATNPDGCSIDFLRNINVVDCIPCDYCASFDLVKNEKYLVSGWVKEVDTNTPYQQVKNYSKSNISVAFTSTNGSNIGAPLNFHTSGEIIDGWQRIVGEFVVPNNVDDMTLDLVNESNANEKMVYFDDIRILPSKGNMKSFVYDQKTQRLMAELDENNYATFYEYDLEGGLVRIKKETEKGVFTIQETRSGTSKNDK